MKEFRADLHTHTFFSDGSKSPEEVILLAKESGMQALSITDHDTIDGYSKELFSFAESEGIYLLSGTEISSRILSTDVHILGYGFDIEDESFISFLQSVQETRRERNLAILEKLKKQNMEISEGELISSSKGRILGRPHIAKLMVDKGYVRDTNEAFAIYLKDHGKCYVPIAKFSPLEVIGKIHEANGKAIIAHPFFIKKNRAVKALLELPFDGVEARYSRMHPDQEKVWIDIANKKNWIITGGSDFHGDFKPQIPIGVSWTNHDNFELLKSS